MKYSHGQVGSIALLVSYPALDMLMSRYVPSFAKYKDDPKKR